MPEISLRQQVFVFLKNNPNIKSDELKEKFKDESWNSVRTYRNQFWKEQKKSDISPITKGKQRDSNPIIPPETTNPTSQPIIDDPDELLYSVAIRELNKSQPDPRWATILIQCRKEIGKRKNEVMDQLQKLPTKNLIEILEKQSGKSLQDEFTN